MTQHSASDSDGLPEPPHIRLIRRLVTVLLVVLILGVIIVVALLVIRLMQAPRAVSLQLPATIALPEGESAQAATIGKGWVMVVSRDGAGIERIRIFDAETGRERQAIEMTGN
ncbi:MAG: hypothetical protein D6754_15430 [Alphaproteobacteria bacterium]|nr:MAG: hypothetical protein D6754_15430 [Alphaproteobacteria bacterium]